MLGRIFGRLEAFTKKSPSKPEVQRAQRRDSIKKREELLKRTISEIRGTTIQEVQVSSPPSKFPLKLLSKRYSTYKSGESESEDSDSSSSTGSGSESDSESEPNRGVKKQSKNDDTMNPLLREFGLEAYASAFKENGFDTPLKIAGMTSSDVDAIKMKLIHKKKLTKMINHLSENPPKAEAGDESSGYSSDSSSQSSQSSQSMSSSQSSLSRQSTQSRQSSQSSRLKPHTSSALRQNSNQKSDSDSDFGYMEKPKAKQVKVAPPPAPVPAPKQNNMQNNVRQAPVPKPSPVQELNYSSSEDTESSSSSSSGSSSSSDSRSRSSSASSMSEMSERDSPMKRGARQSHMRGAMPNHSQAHMQQASTHQRKIDDAAKQLFRDDQSQNMTAPPSPKYVPPQPRKPNPDKYKVSNLIAAAEEHARVLISTIAVQAQLLEKEKLKLASEQVLLQSALQGNSSTTSTLDASVSKIDKRLAADRIERDMLKEAQRELLDSVKSLTEENEDLDDQLEVDEESLQAKSEEIEDLMHQQADIKEEKEALMSLIEETKKKLESKKYLERVAKRQERVLKASYTPTGTTKYANVRYTMKNM